MKVFFIALLLPLFSFGMNENKATNSNPSPTKVTEIQGVDHSLWNTLLQKNVTKEGKVNYKGFKKDSKDLRNYLNLLSSSTPSKSWSKNETLAFWINVYNAFTVKLIVDNYPVKSIKDIKNPWGQKFFSIGGKQYSLEDVEHQVLRKMDEPRIHFAINCASYSCPNILNEAYTESKLEKQLTSSAKSFMNDTTKNSINSDKVEISEIFNWFSSDFSKKGTIIDFINLYSNTKVNNKAKIKYKNYNWSLNE